MKRKTITLALILSAMLFLSACGNTINTPSTETTVDITTEVEAANIVKTDTSVGDETVVEETIEPITEDIILEAEKSIVEENVTPVEVTETTPATTPTYTYTDMSATKYVSKNVNVRELPTSESTKVGSLNTNDKVTVTGQCNETRWYRIEYNGNTAYVSNKYLSDDKVVVNTPSTSNDNTNTNTGTTTDINTSTPVVNETPVVENTEPVVDNTPTPESTPQPAVHEHYFISCEITSGTRPNPGGCYSSLYGNVGEVLWENDHYTCSCGYTEDDYREWEPFEHMDFTGDGLCESCGSPTDNYAFR